MYFFNVMQYNMRDGIGKTGPRIAGTGMESPTPEDPLWFGPCIAGTESAGVFLFSRQVWLVIQLMQVTCSFVLAEFGHELDRLLVQKLRSLLLGFSLL